MIDRMMMSAFCAALFVVFCFGLFAVLVRTARLSFGF